MSSEKTNINYDEQFKLYLNKLTILKKSMTRRLIMEKLKKGKNLNTHMGIFPFL